MEKDREKTMAGLMDRVRTIVFPKVMSRLVEVTHIFDHYYGEERVDLQGVDWDKFRSNFLITYSNLMFPIDSGILEEYEGKEINHYLWILKVRDLATEELHKLTHFIDCVFKEDDDKVKEVREDVLDRIAGCCIPEVWILVHFPEVTVTNENNRSVDIKDLWVKVPLDAKGRMVESFRMNRSNYPLSHLRADYMHSHVNGVNIRYDNASSFYSCCLGEGPIKGTIATLNMDFDPDFWALFCLELDRYVHTESLAGIPYRKLEGIEAATRSLNTDVSCIYTGYSVSLGIRTILHQFIRYFICEKSERQLRFCFRNGAYTLGMSMVEATICISNSFIKWYNKFHHDGMVDCDMGRLISSSGCLYKAVVNDGKIYSENDVDRINIFRSHIGEVVCRFKGKDIKLEITDMENPDEQRNTCLLMRAQIVSTIVNAVLKVLNFRYGREKCATVTREEGQHVPETDAVYV